MSKRKPESAHAQATRILQKLLDERGPLALEVVTRSFTVAISSALLVAVL